MIKYFNGHLPVLQVFQLQNIIIIIINMIFLNFVVYLLFNVDKSPVHNVKQK